MQCFPCTLPFPLLMHWLTQGLSFSPFSPFTSWNAPPQYHPSNEIIPLLLMHYFPFSKLSKHFIFNHFCLSHSITSYSFVNFFLSYHLPQSLYFFLQNYMLFSAGKLFLLSVYLIGDYHICLIIKVIYISWIEPNWIKL